MKNQLPSIFRNHKVWLGTAFCVLVLATVACSDDDVDEPDTGPSDTVDAETDKEDTDTGEEAPLTCEEIDCSEDEVCYHAGCYSTCETTVDCEGNHICNGGRCVDEECNDVNCQEDYACYRGRCYDECTRDRHCGVGTGITCEDGACVPIDDQCEGLECDQIDCGSGESTTVTGTVTIPSGDLPLHNVTVYVPTEEVEPLPEGVSCATCEELISGEPLLQNLSDTKGEFVLPNFPVADEVPLVIQTGKWRRQVEITDIAPCTANELDGELTRLPRNQSEGDIPKIAAHTGQTDALECLISDIGLDDEEFTPADEDGSVNLFYDGYGPSHFASGEPYEDAEAWWSDFNNMKDYDIFIDSCDGTPVTDNKSDLAHLSFLAYLNAGGRAFLTDLQYVWLRYDALPDLQQVVTDWNWTAGGTGLEVETDHSGGQEMRQWLYHVDAVDADGRMELDDPVPALSSTHEDYVTDWLSFLEHGEPSLFSFNMPLGSEGDDACGRVVYSSLHVASSAPASFPLGCAGEPALHDEEKAMIYMLFDLSACIAPECEPLECDVVKGQCGIHADECGGTIECGPCCVGLEESCYNDGDCCDPSWCGDSGVCVAE